MLLQNLAVAIRNIGINQLHLIMGCSCLPLTVRASCLWRKIVICGFSWHRIKTCGLLS